MGQPEALAVSSGRAAGRPSGSVKSAAGSSSGAQGAQRPQRAQTRIFAIIVDETQANPDSVTSIIFVFGEPTRVLFDSGASRSFISTSFALHANRELTPLKSKLIVTTPSGERIVRTSVFKGCEVVVEGIMLKANLIPLEMVDFDVILGMDWLSNHRASMNCFTKKINYEKPGYSNFEFDSDRRVLPTCVISTLEAKRLLLKGCETYLAHVVDTSVTEVKLENVLIVCEFADVFPENLLGLPPDRELEFGIEVLPCSAPISIPLYRMTPMELKELKTQLPDLVDKGFIPRVYLFGVH